MVSDAASFSHGKGNGKPDLRSYPIADLRTGSLESPLDPGGSNSSIRSRALTVRPGADHFDIALGEPIRTGAVSKELRLSGCGGAMPPRT